jgi:hypothetical protein
VRIGQARNIFNLIMNGNPTPHNRLGARVARDRRVDAVDSSNREKRDESSRIRVRMDDLQHFDAKDSKPPFHPKGEPAVDAARLLPNVPVKSEEKSPRQNGSSWSTLLCPA